MQAKEAAAEAAEEAKAKAKAEQDLLKAADRAKKQLEQNKIEREQEENERRAAKDKFIKSKGFLHGSRSILNLTSF